MSPRKNRELTDRQQEVLGFIVDFLQENGYPPTISEIAKGFGMSGVYGVQRHLETLQDKGYLRRESGARSITLSPSVLNAYDTKMGRFLAPPDIPLNATHVPILGRVAAGVPITADQNVEDVMALPNEWVDGRGSVYILRVKGDSMAPGIEDRDLVLVREQTNAENGSLVVALIDEEATVKRFFRERGRIVLRADNPDYDDIVMTTDFRVNGKVIALFRFF